MYSTKQLEFPYDPFKFYLSLCFLFKKSIGNFQGGEEENVSTIYNAGVNFTNTQ